MSIILSGNAGNVTSELSATVTALIASGSGDIEVVTSAPHLFGNNDTVYMALSGSGAQAANGYQTIIVVDSTHFVLQGTAYAGTATGTATDYSLTPQILVPTDGDSFSAQMSGLVSAFQGTLDRTQALKLRTGKWRLLNQYLLSNPYYGALPAPPILTNGIWSNTTGIAQNAQPVVPSKGTGSGGATGHDWSLLLQTLSDTTGVRPQVNAGDMLEYSVTLTAIGQTNSGFGYANIYAALQPGGVVTSGSLVPQGTGVSGVSCVTIPLTASSPTFAVPVTLSASMIVPATYAPPAAPYYDFALSLMVGGDLFGGGATSAFLNLVGTYSGYVNHYRAN